MSGISVTNTLIYLILNTLSPIGVHLSDQFYI